MRCVAAESPQGAVQLSARRCTMPSRLRCRASNQKNEGMYFEYRPTGKSKEEIAEEQKNKTQREQQQFGWANTARSSVHHYRKSVNSQRPKKPNKPLSNSRPPSEQQQQHAAAAAQQTKLETAAATTEPPTLQHKPVVENPSTADADADADAAPYKESSPSAVQPPSQPTSSASAAGAHSGASRESSSSSSSGKGATMLERKQQMLQRMKGAAAAAINVPPAAAAVAGADSSTTINAVQSPQQQAGAVADAAAAAAAGAAVAAAWDKEPVMEAEGELLLQELIELAEQLSGPGGYNSVIDSDPMADPLAGLLVEDGDAELQSEGWECFVEPVFEDNQGVGAAGDFDDAEAEELFAAVAAMQQQARSAAAALAADDVVPDHITAADIGSSGKAGTVGSAAAELLAWEAEQAAGQQQIDIEAAAAAMQRGEVLGMNDEADYEDGDLEMDEDDADWLENDSQLKKMMQEDGAAFARMLAELNEDTDSSSSGSKAETAAGDEVQQESWADLEIEDWLAAAESASAAAAAGYEDDSEETELSGLLGAINADPSLDQQAKMQAKLSIQGMFNDPSVAAGSSSKRQRSSSSSSKRQQQTSSSTSIEKAADRGLATAGAAESEQQTLELQPKPVRPSVLE